jgi:hypothetical protein
VVGEGALPLLAIKRLLQQISIHRYALRSNTCHVIGYMKAMHGEKS